MNKSDLLEFIPSLHNIDEKEIKNIQKDGQKGLTKYQILKLLCLESNQGNYKKLNECIVVGLLKCVNDNPPQFLPDRDRIWEFWNENPVGSQCMEMMKRHTVILE